MYGARAKDRLEGSGYTFAPMEVDEAGHQKFRIRGFIERPIAAGTFTGSAAPIFTAAQDMNVKIRLANIDTSSRTVTLYRIVSGGSAADTNTLMKTHILGPGEVRCFNRVGMRTGMFLEGLCSSAGLVSYAVDEVE